VGVYKTNKNQKKTRIECYIMIGYCSVFIINWEAKHEDDLINMVLKNRLELQSPDYTDTIIRSLNIFHLNSKNIIAINSLND